MFAFRICVQKVNNNCPFRLQILLSYAYIFIKLFRVSGIITHQSTKILCNETYLQMYVNSLRNCETLVKIRNSYFSCSFRSDSITDCVNGKLNLLINLFVQFFCDPISHSREAVGICAEEELLKGTSREILIL